MTRDPQVGPQDWSKLEVLWEAARELPPHERDEMLASHAVDGALRAELESLLRRADAAEAFFDRLLTVVPQSEHAVAQEDPDAVSRENAAGASDTPARPEADPMIGTTVGHYQIVGRIGEGGMGRVYRAIDLHLRRTVALKLLRPRSSDTVRARERLLVEARAAAALDHANICTIYEIGETADHLSFIAMAYYMGETLERAMRRGPLPVHLALGYATQIARGLGAAHQGGIIHRDVKPANIIVTPEGVLKLLDFGIARTADVGSSHEGVTPGTLAYMSPEQVTSRQLDSRTDLWSLGVVLYEMCTGVRPFRGDNAGAILYAILHDVPAPASAVRRELPAPIDSIIARLLAKDPADRYRKAEQLIVDLARSSHSPSVAQPNPERDVTPERTARAAERDEDLAAAAVETTSPPATARWSRRAGSYLVAALVLGAVMLFRPGTPARITDARDGTPSAQRVAAMDLYKQGRRDVLFRTDSGRRLARYYFRQAIEKDSTFAPAHASMALMALVPGEHGDSTLALAEAHARTAIRLDGSHAEAHTALGRILMFKYRFPEAEVELRKAVDLAPAQPDLREFLVWLYVFTERPGDALEEARRFVRAAPSASNAIAELAQGYVANGRCDEALAQVDRLKHLQPPLARTGRIAAQCYLRKREWQKAIDEMRRVAATNVQAMGNLGFMLARAGRRDSAEAIRDTLLARYRRGEVPAFGLAVIYAGLREFDDAFHWLDRAYSDRSLRPEIMEPMFEELHRDPRFNGLREKLGIQTRRRR